MESLYRLWIQERNNAAKATTGVEFASGELRRELRTALGTAKFLIHPFLVTQLEELERAVRSNDDACSAGEDTRVRHDKFIVAIGSQISTVEDCFRQWNLELGETAVAWVRLDDGERDELARFLSGLSCRPIPSGMGGTYQSDKVPVRGSPQMRRRLVFLRGRERCRLIFPCGDEGAASSSRARTRQCLVFQLRDEASPSLLARGRGNTSFSRWKPHLPARGRGAVKFGCQRQAIARTSPSQSLCATHSSSLACPRGASRAKG
ncbi:hypothetical protein BHM03_00005711 [Ensete ventricosum]|nr:hypothetical protein BHM03_00005711 [Ensete ventricosum]